MSPRRRTARCLLHLDGAPTLAVALPYEEARERVRVATEEGYMHVELPIDWVVEGSGETRDSLVALRHILTLRSAPEAMA